MPRDFKTEIMPYLNEVHAHHYDKDYKPAHKINKSELLEFLEPLYERITPNQSLPEVIKRANITLFNRYCYNLVIFRACMVSKNQIKPEGMEYIDFATKSEAPNDKRKIYARNLYEGNPLLIKQHISELCKVVQNNQDVGLSKEALKMLSKEIEVHLMAMIDRLDPTCYQSQRILLTGYRELLLYKLADTYLPEDKKDPETLVKLCHNAKELLLAAKGVTSDQSLELYNDASLIRDFPLGDTVDDTLALIDDMQAMSSTLRV